MRRTPLASATLVVALLLAVPAHAAWTTRTLPTGEATFLRGLDARSDGQPQLLTQRRRDGAWRLELRSGGAYRKLDESAHQPLGVEVGHDGRNGVVVAWSRGVDTSAGRSGPRQVFVWTTHGGTRQLTRSASSVSVFGLAVASDRSTVLGLYSRGQVQVLGHGPDSDVFGAPQTLSAPGSDPGFPAVAAGPRGRFVVVWPERDHLVARVTEAGEEAFGDPQVITPEEDPEGDVGRVTGVSAGIASGGRVVIAFQSSIRDAGGRIVKRRADGVAWEPGAPGPSAPWTLSQSVWAGVPQLTMRGDVACLVWTETGSTGRPAHVLRSVRWSGETPGDLASFRGPQNFGSTAKRIVVAALPGARVRVYWQPSVGGRFQTTTLDEEGRASGVVTITAPQGYVADAMAALTGNRSLLAWTNPGKPYRVLTARS